MRKLKLERLSHKDGIFQLMSNAARVQTPASNDRGTLAFSHDVHLKSHVADDFGPPCQIDLSLPPSCPQHTPPPAVEGLRTGLRGHTPG